MFRGTRVWKSLLHWPVVARIVLVVVAASIASPPSLMYNAFATSCIPDDPYACGGAGSGQTCCSGNCSSNCCNNSPCDGGLCCENAYCYDLDPTEFSCCGMFAYDTSPTANQCCGPGFTVLSGANCVKAGTGCTPPDCYANLKIPANIPPNNITVNITSKKGNGGQGAHLTALSSAAFKPTS